VSKEAAEAANISKSAFLAAMSHELRTPLNAILGFSEIIGTEVMGPVGVAAYREYADDIHSSGKHLLAIINDVLDMAKIGSGQFELRENDIDMAAIVRDGVNMLRHQAQVSGVSLEISLPALLPLLQGDEIRIRQVLVNLLSNAVKFTPPGGRVRAQVALSADGGLALIISDTGIGMTPEQIKLARQPFRQIDSALARKYEGTGLGVPLADGFMHLHGGHLEITSEPNIGTVITAQFPPERVVLSRMSSLDVTGPISMASPL
jgi:signal transduction histidine kinase